MSTQKTVGKWSIRSERKDDRVETTLTYNSGYSEPLQMFFLNEDDLHDLKYAIESSFRHRSNALRVFDRRVISSRVDMPADKPIDS